MSLTRRRGIALGGIALADFALRIAIVRPGSFQFSDGIRLIDWNMAVAGKVQPLVPALVAALVRVGVDPILSAGLIASTLGALAVFPLFMLARRLYDEETGWWVVLLYSANFFIYIQSAGVTANSALVFALLMGVLAVLDVAESGARYGAVPLLFWAGVATLARPEGLLLVPLAVVFSAWYGWKRGTDSLPALSLAAVPLGLWAYWNVGVTGGFEYGGEIALGATLATPAKLAKYLLSYLKDFSAGLLHVYTVAAFAGVVASLRLPPAAARSAWHAVLGYCAGAFFLVLGLHWAFVPRLLAPLIVLALVPAGLALRLAARRHAVLRAVCAVLLALTFLGGTAIVVGLKRNVGGIGGDIRAAAAALPLHTAPGDRIVSDLPTETAYYSGRKAGFYVRALAKSGDVVILHNIITDLGAEERALRKRFAVRVLFERTAPYVSPTRGGLPVVAGGVAMMDLSEREKPLAEEPYRTVVLRLSAR
jgi:hypothetical protein